MVFGTLNAQYAWTDDVSFYYSSEIHDENYPYYDKGYSDFYKRNLPKIYDHFWLPMPDIFVKESAKAIRKIRKQKEESELIPLPNIAIESDRKHIILTVQIASCQSSPVKMELTNKKKETLETIAFNDSYDLSLWQHRPGKYFLNFYLEEDGRLLKRYKVFRY